APALPARENRLRASHRRRLLLRLRCGAALRAGRSRGDRKQDGRGREGRLPVCARRGFTPGSQAALQRRSAQTRADRRPRSRRGDLRLYRRPVRGLVPRAARAEHRADQALQAAARGRRVLARRRAPPDAAAHLRHGLVHQGRPRRLPAPARGGQEARSSCAGQAARPVVDSGGRRPGTDSVAPQGGDAQLPAGTLHGMLRVRGLSMDDAHLFLREDQIEQEIFQLLDIVELVLGKTFGLSYRLDLATRPEKKLGGDATWDQAERALEQALKHRGAKYRIDQGGGAFYGPKIDIKFNDAIGREWQGATIQLDFE